jgi:hypothetical protein
MNVTAGETYYITISTFPSPDCTPFDIAVTSCGGGGGINISNGSTTTCSTDFYDSGGAGSDYSSNENFVYTICPDVAGNYIIANFTSFDIENNYDFLTIYDGNTTGAPVVGGGAYTGTTGPGSVQASGASGASGCLTFEFTSDGSGTSLGWVADITCTATGPTCSDGIQNQGETGIDCGGPCATVCPPEIIPTVCSSATYTLPSGSSANFYDDGGPGGGCNTDEAPGNFANAGCETITTICAAPGEFLIADFSVFSMFGTDSGFDWMVIYEGPSASGTILFDNRSGAVNNPDGTDCTYDGTSLNLCAIGRCLTFRFNGTGVVSREGWDAVVMSVPVECVPLPISLLSFTGEKVGSINKLTWQTETEINNDYFFLEHSADGYAWSEITKVNGAGYSTSIKSYSFDHRDFPKAINYYRLTQVDYDGKRETFQIVSIDNKHDRNLIKRVNMIGQEVNQNYKGIVIEYYDDNTHVKQYQE